MNCRFAVVLLLLAASILGCGKMEEYEPVGTWIGQTAGLGNGPNSFREVWSFKDGKITVEGSDTTYGYKIDSTKDPKQIDITADFPGRGKEVRMGIYKIEDDTLTMTHIMPPFGGIHDSRIRADSKRPEEFYPTERDDVIVLTFQREQ